MPEMLSTSNLITGYLPGYRLISDRSCSLTAASLSSPAGMPRFLRASDESTWRAEPGTRDPAWHPRVPARTAVTHIESTICLSQGTRFCKVMRRLSAVQPRFAHGEMLQNSQYLQNGQRTTARWRRAAQVIVPIVAAHPATIHRFIGKSPIETRVQQSDFFRGDPPAAKNIATRPVPAAIIAIESLFSPTLLSCVFDTSKFSKPSAVRAH